MTRTDAQALERVSLLTPELLVDPHPYFAELLAHRPVLWNEAHRAWLIARYDDVVAAFRSEAFGSDRIGPYARLRDARPGADLERMFTVLGKWMVFLSPPDHSRLRILAHRSFTPRQVRILKSRVETVAAELAAHLRARIAPRGSSVDLVEGFCLPLPGRVIAGVFGVPEADGEMLKSWAEELGLFINGSAREEDRDRRVADAILEFEKYLKSLIAGYRRRPADNILSGLVTANDQDDALSEEEVVATSMLILDAGYKTVQNALGNALVLLLDSPRDYQRLQDDSDLVPAAVEELLRLNGPSRLSVRRAVHDLELGGCRISKDSRVYLLQAAANRDPRRFDDPNELRIDRTSNSHLAFGMGIHFCLGAALARMELTSALSVLLRQLPPLELAEPAACLPRHRLLLLNGLERLPVRIARGDRR
jgi:cytochrome P450